MNKWRLKLFQWIPLINLNSSESIIMFLIASRQISRFISLRLLQLLFHQCKDWKMSWKKVNPKIKIKNSKVRKEKRNKNERVGKDNVEKQNHCQEWWIAYGSDGGLPSNSPKNRYLNGCRTICKYQSKHNSSFSPSPLSLSHKISWKYLRDSAISWYFKAEFWNFIANR